MSHLKLYRKEALKKQYKSKEFGEAIIEQPEMIDNSILFLIASVCVLVVLVFVTPVEASKHFVTQHHKSNYFPVVMPQTTLVDKHLVADGTEVSTSTSVAQIRFFNHATQGEVQQITAGHAGTYFSIATAGDTTKEYQAIGRILLPSQYHEYSFWIEDEQVSANQKVQLEHAGQSMTGTITSVSAKYHSGQRLIVVQLQPPYEKNLLNPNHTLRIRVLKYRANFLEMLQG